MDTLYLYQMLTGLPARKAVRYNKFSTCDWSIFLNSVFLLVETDNSDSLVPGGDGLSDSLDEKIPRLKKVEQQFEKLANNEQNKTFIFKILPMSQRLLDCWSLVLLPVTGTGTIFLDFLSRGTSPGHKELYRGCQLTT